jgi:hypothetical protein
MPVAIEITLSNLSEEQARGVMTTLGIPRSLFSYTEPSRTTLTYSYTSPTEAATAAAQLPYVLGVVPQTKAVD